MSSQQSLIESLDSTSQISCSSATVSPTKKAKIFINEKENCTDSSAGINFLRTLYHGKAKTESSPKRKVGLESPVTRGTRL